MVLKQITEIQKWCAMMQKGRWMRRWQPSHVGSSDGAFFLMLQQVRWAEVEAAQPQKIMISWQPAVWFIEILAGRPFTIHLPYSDMKFTVQ
jgi:hypothetical protein